MTEDDFENDDVLYDYLTAVYRFLYEDGTDDAIYEVLERGDKYPS